MRFTSPSAVATRSSRGRLRKLIDEVRTQFQGGLCDFLRVLRGKGAYFHRYDSGLRIVVHVQALAPILHHVLHRRSNGKPRQPIRVRLGVNGPEINALADVFDKLTTIQIFDDNIGIIVQRRAAQLGQDAQFVARHRALVAADGELEARCILGRCDEAEVENGEKSRQRNQQQRRHPSVLSLLEGACLACRDRLGRNLSVAGLRIKPAGSDDLVRLGCSGGVFVRTRLRFADTAAKLAPRG